MATPLADTTDTAANQTRGQRAVLWALGIIFAANFLNYMDRQLVSALEKPIRADLHLTGEQHGLLWSLFTIGYMVCAIPIGPLADRFSRTRLFALCVLVWSVATLGSGWSPSKEVLYVARVLIGVGEAGCLVIGPSLISDLFSREVRGRALSLFYLAMPLGGTAAFIVAGLFFDLGWRNLFYLAGAPGFVVAALIWLMADPPRGGSEGAHHGMKSGGLGQYLQLLKTRTLLLIILAQACAVFFLVPLIHFGVKFFEDPPRNMPERKARLALGLIALTAGGLGNLLSGFIGDRLFRRTKSAYSIMSAVGYLAAWPCLYVGFTATVEWVYLAAITAGSFFIFLCMPAVNTQIANVTSPTQRASAWALAVFISHLLGDTVSPPIFGYLDRSMPREQVFTLFSFALLLAGLCCLLATCTARADTERAMQSVEHAAK